jgi:hypothetical protein
VREGFVAVEVPPSPKVHAREAIVPSMSVELSVKVAGEPLVTKPKFAVGATFAAAVTVTAWVSELVAPWLSVTVSVTL